MMKFICFVLCMVFSWCVGTYMGSTGTAREFIEAYPECNFGTPAQKPAKKSATVSPVFSL